MTHPRLKSRDTPKQLPEPDGLRITLRPSFFVPMPQHPDTPPPAQIVLRIDRPRKGRYVAAARAEGLTLAAWILRHLDSGAQAQLGPDPFPEKSPPPTP